MPDKYDITVKDLFSDMGTRQDLVNFFAGGDFKLTGDLAIEFTRIEKRLADLLLLAEDRLGPLAVHVEFQSRNDPHIGPRMLRYAAEILKKYRLRVYQTVIYFGNAGLKMKSGLSYYFDTSTKLDFGYRLVDLGNFTREQINKHHNQHLRAFLPVVERSRRIIDGINFLEACVDDIISSDLPLEDKRWVILHAELLAGLAFSEQVIKKTFEGVEVMLNLRESAGYRRLFQEAEEIGEKKGEKKGEKRGERRGEVKGAKMAIQQFLAARFGEQSLDIQGKIQELTDLSLLNKEIPSIFSANTLEEARTIIERISPGSPKGNKAPKG